MWGNSISLWNDMDRGLDLMTLINLNFFLKSIAGSPIFLVHSADTVEYTNCVSAEE